MLFWLLLLGIITYFILQRSVVQITRTPVWILWLVMMTPALIWSAWVLVYGTNQPIPTALVIIPFLICPLLYWFLVQMGRQPRERPQSAPTPEKPAESEERSILLPPLEPAEEETLRHCFPWTVFPLQNLEYRHQAIICRGQLRAESEQAYQTIRGNIEEKFGDRFLVIFQQDFKDKYFFALVSNPQRFRSQSSDPSDPLNRPLLALALLLITLFTTTLAGAEMLQITPKAWQSDPSLLIQGLPYGIALMLILGIHEFAHYITARLYKMRVTLPYFMPVPFFLGTLGAFIQMRSPMPNRKALFDIGVAGPWAGFLVTLPLLIWGFSHSTIVDLDPEKSGILTFQALNPSFSLLLTVLSKLSLGTALTATKAINLHPVAITGYIGLIVTAFNLLPIGQLDGGHIIHAMFGQKMSLTIGQVTRFLVLILALIQREFLILAVLLFFLPIYDDPALNDVSELDNKRDIFGFITLSLLLLILLPVPRTLAQFLHY